MSRTNNFNFSGVDSARLPHASRKKLKTLVLLRRYPRPITANPLRAPVSSYAHASHRTFRASGSARQFTDATSRRARLDRRTHGQDPDQRGSADAPARSETHCVLGRCVRETREEIQNSGAIANPCLAGPPGTFPWGNRGGLPGAAIKVTVCLCRSAARRSVPLLPVFPFDSRNCIAIAFAGRARLFVWDVDSALSLRRRSWRPPCRQQFLPLLWRAALLCPGKELCAQLKSIC